MIGSKFFDRLGDSVVLIFKRLPTIALYTVAFFALFSVGSNAINRYHTYNDKKFYQHAPATHFINYTSFIVQPAREGEDLTYTVCRNHDANYNVDGFRTVYVIPEGKSEDARVFVLNKAISGVVDTGGCASYFIRDSAYHFSPGNYQITLNLDFKVKYDFMKHVSVKSNIFRVRPVPVE